MNIFRCPFIGNDGKLMPVIQPPEPPEPPESPEPPVRPPEAGTIISSRVTLVDVNTVRTLRGCDARNVLICVADATHPQFLRWVFNLAVDGKDVHRRNLRFWRDEVENPAMDKCDEPAQAIQRILGQRAAFSRAEIEIAWTLNATTIIRLLRHGEIVERNHQLTRDSLASFLERRLQ